MYRTAGHSQLSVVCLYVTANVRVDDHRATVLYVAVIAAAARDRQAVRIRKESAVGGIDVMTVQIDDECIGDLQCRRKLYVIKQHDR